MPSRNLVNSLPSSSSTEQHPLKRKQTHSFDDRINNNSNTKNNNIPLTLTSTVPAPQNPPQTAVAEDTKNVASQKTENKVRRFRKNYFFLNNGKLTCVRQREISIKNVNLGKFHTKQLKPSWNERSYYSYLGESQINFFQKRE